MAGPFIFHYPNFKEERGEKRTQTSHLCALLYFTAFKAIAPSQLTHLSFCALLFKGPILCCPAFTLISTANIHPPEVSSNVIIMAVSLLICGPKPGRTAKQSETGVACKESGSSYSVYTQHLHQTLLHEECRSQLRPDVWSAS